MVHSIEAPRVGGTYRDDTYPEQVDMQVRSLGDLAELVLPTVRVRKGRVRVSYTATHGSR